MYPYWILFSVFAVGAMQTGPLRGRDIQGGPIFLFAGLLVALMVGLRNEVGGDWFNYLFIFQDIAIYGFSALRVQDPAYTVLNLLAAKAGLGMGAVNLVCAALFTWGLVVFARRQPNPWLVILVAVPYLVIVVAMGYTRQAVAIGIILAGLTKLEKGVIRFTLYVLCAAAFHKSAVAVLPLVALSTPQKRIVTLAIVAVSTAILFYVFIRSSYDVLVTNYLSSDYSAQGAAVRIAMNVPPALLYLAFSKRFTNSEQERRLWRNFALAAIIILVLLWFAGGIVALDRIALYLIPLQMFVLSRFPYVFSEKGSETFMLTAVIVVYSAAIQYIWLNYAVNSEFWIPYQIYGFESQRPPQF